MCSKVWFFSHIINKIVSLILNYNIWNSYVNYFSFCINILPQVAIWIGPWTISLSKGFNHIKHQCVDLWSIFVSNCLRCFTCQEKSGFRWTLYQSAYENPLLLLIEILNQCSCMHQRISGFCYLLRLKVSAAFPIKSTIATS